MNKPWKHKIDIKQYLGEGTTDEDVVKAAKGIVRELKRLPSKLDGLSEAIDEFEDIAESTHDPEDNEYLVEEFNYQLDKLYDWADYERIWMGL